MDGTIHQIETDAKLRQIYEHLLRSDPTNVELRRESEKLGVDKSRFCEKLITQWESRVQPIHNEYSIQEINSEYLSRIDSHLENDALTNRTMTNLGQRDWIIKNSNAWTGYCAESSSYLEEKYSLKEN